MNDFLRWADEKGVKAEGIEIKEAEPGAGFGVFSHRVHPPESLLIRLPHSLLITAGSVADIGKYKTIIEMNSEKPKPFELLTLFFCLENPDDSPYGPYLRILPKSFDTPIAQGISFDVNEIPLITRGFYELQLQELETVWEKVQNLCKNSGFEVEHEKFLWAWHVVNTRCIYLENPTHPLIDSSDGDTIAVIPYVDMLNHDPGAQGFAFYDKVRKEYCVRATKTVADEEQVFVCYGPHDNVRLWIEYGFTLKENPNRKVAIPQDLLVALAKKVGVAVSPENISTLNDAGQPSTIYASDEGPSWSLSTNVQILLMSREELKRWREIVYAEENPRRRSRRKSDDGNEENERRLREERSILREMLRELVTSIRQRGEKVSDFGFGFSGEGAIASPVARFWMSDAGGNLQSSAIPGGGTSIQGWIDQVEKDFDKAFVSLDLLLGEVDSDQIEITYEGRGKMTSLSSCFAQLLHKTQTLHHALSRQKTETVALREELVTAQGVAQERHKEAQQLLVQVHSLQCELHSKTAPHESDMIKKKLDLEINAFREEVIPSLKLEFEVGFVGKFQTQKKPK
ncbi:unnamed protein product, partial [Mesorhabditis belari]|uniref:SET domain-containing protein n=1 Tax=Mesorhabditis belari TaxID=2138241 RepID=A0AAF3ETV9_9BILA